MYLAMEHLKGCTLDQYLDDRGPLPLADAVTLGHRVAEALAEAHAQDILHRDVKPTNLFLAESDPSEVKLLDFGIARIVGGEELTAPGMPVGTPAYMAPEQARDVDFLDGRVDIFTLGLVLFEALTGVPVFLGESIMAVLAKILVEPAPRLREKLPDAPKSLEVLLGRMLEKEPEQRPARAADIALELESIAREIGGSIPPTPLDSLRPSALFGTGEQLSVILVRDAEPSVPFTQRSRREMRRRREVIEHVAAVFDSHAEQLSEGTLVLVISSDDPGPDHMLRATEAAISLAEQLTASIGIATLDANVGGEWTPGQAIDVASALLGTCAPEGIFLDAKSVRMLAGQIPTRREGNERWVLDLGAVRTTAS